MRRWNNVTELIWFRESSIAGWIGILFYSRVNGLQHSRFLAVPSVHSYSRDASDLTYNAELTDANFITHEKVAILSPNVTCTLHIHIFGTFVLSFPWESFRMHISTLHAALAWLIRYHRMFFSFLLVLIIASWPHTDYSNARAILRRCQDGLCQRSVTVPLHLPNKISVKCNWASGMIIICCFYVKNWMLARMTDNFFPVTALPQPRTLAALLPPPQDGRARIVTAL